ncbi:MAG: hypothetical protein IPN29_05985 [Saprospiraceae bacterium]|nr:hypothetical protein [Saprospiraceae bacterium]
MPYWNWNRHHTQLRSISTQSLMKLRQLANHPRLADKSSKVESGKYEDIINTMETLVLAGNKILVFSSFVSHLDLYKTFLNEKNSLCVPDG